MSNSDLNFKAKTLLLKFNKNENNKSLRYIFEQNT